MSLSQWWEDPLDLRAHTAISSPLAFGSLQNPENSDIYMSPSGPSSTDIQAHLYNSFLEGKAADVVLNVDGTWRAIYRLHRVVLIQAVRFSRHTRSMLGCADIMFASVFRVSSVPYSREDL